MINIKSHIILVGLMGTGKSTIGKELAEDLGVNFIDTDQVIEQIEGRTISDIFINNGEVHFRKIESDTLKDILDNNEPSVIATGGGIVLAEENRSKMKPHYVIRLDASMEEIYRRVSVNSERPLLANSSDLEAKINQLRAQRESLYREVADYTIITDHKTPKLIAKEIEMYLQSLYE